MPPLSFLMLPLSPRFPPPLLPLLLLPPLERLDEPDEDELPPLEREDPLSFDGRLGRL